MPTISTKPLEAQWTPFAGMPSPRFRIFGHLRSAIVIPALLACFFPFLCESVPAKPKEKSKETSISGALPGYTHFAEFKKELQKLSKSPWVELDSLGKTRSGKDIFLLTLGSRNEEAVEIPSLFVLGSIDPRHVAGSEVLVKLAQHLSRKASKDEATRKWLETYRLYMIPRPSPDAYEAFFQEPYQERERNGRPHDDDRDGRTDEDGPEDLNQDGWITQMRVETPYGRYVAAPEDPRLMTPYDSVFSPEDAEIEDGNDESTKEKEVTRYDLYTEGWDNDADEKFNEDGRGGVALNRNFTFNYEYFGPAAGPHQVSEPESRALADFAFDHPEIAMVVSFSPNDNLVNRWKAKLSEEQGRIKNELLEIDQPAMDFFSNAYRKAFQISEEPPAESETTETIPGSVGTWAYFHYGRFSLIAPCWQLPSKEEEKDDQEEVREERKNEKDRPEKEKKELTPETKEQLEALEYMDENKIDGFVPWKRYKHRDFPERRVEIGGFKPFYRITPPKKSLAERTEQLCDYLHFITDSLPDLRFQEVKTEKLGSDFWRITVVLENRGSLPTMPKMGEINGIPQPIQIALDLPEGTEFLTRPPRIRVPRLESRSLSEEFAWLVRVPRHTEATEKLPLALEAWSPSVGHIHWPEEQP